MNAREEETGHRIKQRKFDAVTGQEVDSHNIITADSGQIDT
jgi:hypothetical protein